MNFVDETGCSAYKFIKKNASNSTIKKYAKELFVSESNKDLFEVGYQLCFGNDANYRPYSYKIPIYLYQKTTLNKNLQRVQVYYIHRNANNMRAVGRFYYKTILQWKLYIESRHKPLFLRMRDYILNKYEISIDTYEIFMNALSDVAAGTAAEFPLAVYSIAEAIFEEISDHRDKLDNYIIKLIKRLEKKKENHEKYYIMISFATYYQQYGLTKNDIKWHTVSSKKIKNCL